MGYKKYLLGSKKEKGFYCAILVDGPFPYKHTYNNH
jgi:hypothetical protein